MFKLAAIGFAISVAAAFVVGAIGTMAAPGLVGYAVGAIAGLIAFGICWMFTVLGVGMQVMAE